MRVLLALALLLTLSSSALADYQPAKVYVIFIDEDWYNIIDELTAAEFAIENLPFDLCTITEHWNTNLIIGDAGTGIALAFSPPLTGPLFVLGYLEFIAWEPVPDAMDQVAHDAYEVGVLDEDPGSVRGIYRLDPLNRVLDDEGLPPVEVSG